MTVSNSTFTSNSGIVFGGAIDNGTSNGTVLNCTLHQQQCAVLGSDQQLQSSS